MADAARAVGSWANTRAAAVTVETIGRRRWKKLGRRALNSTSRSAERQAPQRGLAGRYAQPCFKQIIWGELRRYGHGHARLCEGYAHVMSDWPALPLGDEAMNAVLIGMLVYVLAQFAVGAWVSRRMTNEADYILAGRRLGTGLVVFSVFATYFGAEAIVA